MGGLLNMKLFKSRIERTSKDIFVLILSKVECQNLDYVMLKQFLTLHHRNFHELSHIMTYSSLLRKAVQNGS